MPSSVIAAVAGAVVKSLFANAIIGALAGAFVSTLISSAFGSRREQTAAPAFEQQVRARTLTVRQPISYWQIIYGRAKVGGAITFIHSDSNTLNLVITVAGHVCEELGDIYFGDELVPLDGSGNATGRFAGHVLIQKSLGDESGQPFPDLIAATGGKWTDAHRQSGRAKLRVQLTFNQDLFPSGIPNITVITKGRKVYDPRSDVTEWSSNSALCANDYLTHTVYGVGAVYASEIDEDTLIAAANVCEESMTLAAGGTENRYETHGAFTLPRAARDLLPELLGAMQGTAVQIGGVWFLRAGAYIAPTETFDEDDARAPIRVSTRLSRRDSFNAVKGVFVNPDQSWQPTDFPPITNATYLAEDGDERIWKDIKLNFTTSASMAQRIAKIELEKVRQQITVQFPGKLSTWRVQPPENIAIDNTRLGWSGKVFELTELQMVVEEDESGNPVLGVDHSLRETAATVYDWNSGEETTVDPAPDTDLPNPFDIDAPGAPSVTEVLYETREGRGVAVKAAVSWMISDDAFVDNYQLEYRLTGAWTVLPRVAALSFDVLDIAPGTYEFRVKAISVAGVSSDYSPTTTISIVGLTARPVTPVIRGLQIAGGSAIMTIDPATDLDVRNGGRVRVRHCEDTVTPTWETSFSIGDSAGDDGTATVIVRPLKAGAYLVKFIDSTGNESEDFASISTKQASVLAFTPLDDIEEDPVFAGAFANTIVSGGYLRLAGVGMFDDIGDFDSMSDLDGYGGLAGAGSYTFAAGFDFGSVTRVRLTGEMAGFVENQNDLIDDRDADIDDWGDFDGASAGSAADAWIEVRETDDDPGGSPAWSDWKRLDAAEFDAWGVEARVQLVAYDPAYNIAINTLRIHAEELA